jgi:hypothetical protein
MTMMKETIVRACQTIGRNQDRMMFLDFKLMMVIIALLISCSVFATGPHRTLIEKPQWEKEAKAYNYTENYKNKKENTEKKNNKPAGFPLASLFSNIGEAKYLIGGIIILILITLIILLILSSYKDFNSKIKDDKNGLKKTIDNIENADLESMLNQALASGSFKEAVRVRYLMLLRTLSRLRFVIWQKDKTNGIYIHEMYGKNGFELFLKLTYNFDRIWYGEQEVNETDYHNLIPLFEQMDKIVTTGE